MHRLIPGHGPDPWTREAFGCGFYPGPGHAPPAPQDRLRKCSLATVDPHRTGNTRNTATQRSNRNGLKQRPEHHASRVDGKLLTELLGALTGNARLEGAGQDGVATSPSFPRKQLRYRLAAMPSRGISTRSPRSHRSGASVIHSDCEAISRSCIGSCHQDPAATPRYAGWLLAMQRIIYPAPHWYYFCIRPCIRH